MEGAKYPLQMLPQEMWEMIILEVKDSEDIRSLMKASKQLNDVFIKKRHLWLLDKVLPILMKTTKSISYLEIEDMYNLRLVDKRWNRAVNTFLENQPCLRPFNRDDDKVNSEADIWSEWSVEKCIRRGSLGQATFGDFDQISKFGDEFKNTENSPFFSRSVFGLTKTFNSENEDYVRRYPNLACKGKQAFWEHMNHKVFKRFGKEIWFLEMRWENDVDEGSIWKAIVNTLSSLPNLKNFNLDIFEINSIGEAKEFPHSEECQFPPLPFHESLRLVNYQDIAGIALFPGLVSKYCLQLRRLHLSVTCRVWDGAKCAFPNLTELFLEEVCAGEKY